MASRRAICIASVVLAVGIGVAGEWRGARGQSTTFRVIGPNFVVVGQTVYHLDPLNAPLGWHKLPEGGLTLPPVPASSLISYENGTTAITDSGEGWGNVYGVCTDLGPVPGSVPTTRESWGQLKSKYAR